MNYKNPIVHSLGHAVLVGVYVWAVASIMEHAQQWFGPMPNILAAVALLMLFVVSATIVGALVLGRPGLLYFNGQKKEALQFFAWTVGWLIVLTTVVFIALAVRK